jgi:hypothetical protein
MPTVKHNSPSKLAVLKRKPAEHATYIPFYIFSV